MNQEYRQYLENKNVVIVGPAPYMEGSNYGEVINNYDIVVRINKSVPIPEELKCDIGNRTDILYNCLEPHPDSGGIVDSKMWKSQGVKWISSPYPPIPPFVNDIVRFQNNNTENIPFNIFDGEYYNEIATSLKTRPNSGILAMADLLCYNIKTLRVLGFTLYKGGYYQQYRPWDEEKVFDIIKRGGNHHQDRQAPFIASIIKDDSRVIVDEHLINAIKSFGVEI